MELCVPSREPLASADGGGETGVIVKVADLSGVVRQTRFDEEVEPLNELLRRSARGVEPSFEDKLRVDAEMYRRGSDVYLQGSLGGTVRSICPRCTDEFPWRLQRDFRFLIVKGSDGFEPEDDAGLDHYTGDEIDVGPLIREQALLALDESVLCSEDCKGLCVRCGANLNREQCNCEARGHK